MYDIAQLIAMRIELAEDYDKLVAKQNALEIDYPGSNLQGLMRTVNVKANTAAAIAQINHTILYAETLDPLLMVKMAPEPEEDEEDAGEKPDEDPGVDPGEEE